MEEKQFIKKLFDKNSDYNNPDQAIATANLCNTISKDIYTDSQRFIYELLQNADDASNQHNKLDVQIDFVGNYVIISHKGEPFSKIDIESISSAGDGTKTGFKGIGFKSVFSHSNYVIIKSNNFCFRYDKNFWKNHWNSNWVNQKIWLHERRTKKKDDQLKMPWQMIPIWTELPLELKQLSAFQQFNVSTVIQYDQIEEIKQDLSNLLSNTQIVLFLRSQEVKITVNSNEKLTIEKIKTEKTTVLKRNGNLQSEWLIKTEQFNIPEKVQKEINADEKSPKRLKEALSTEISFAIQLKENKLNAVNKENSLIFTYLPTSINYNFPFLVNASFLTDAGRQHLHQDVFWNNWIFEQIPLKFFAWVAELANKTSEYSQQILRILPNRLNSYGTLEQSYNRGYQKALETIAFLPNLSGDLLKVSEAIFDKVSMSEVINKTTLINYLNHKLAKNFTIQSFLPDLELISTLNKIGVIVFDLDDLEGFITSDIFIIQHQVHENFNLIKFLFDQANHSGNAEEWKYKIKHINFIFNENCHLCKPINLLFGQHSKVTNEEVIHNSILSQIKNNQAIYNWLLQLGVKEPTDTAFIDLIIQQPENFINHSNAIETIRFIFNIYKHNLITSSQFEELRKVQLITKQGTLLSCEKCYLSNFYEPELKLEQIYNDDIYVSEDYVESQNDKIEWKAFFIKMNVKQNIESYELNNPSILSLSSSFGNEYFDVNKGYLSQTFIKRYNRYGFDSHNQISFFRNLSFLENTLNNHTFAKIFWNSVISTQELELNYLLVLPTLSYGLGKRYNYFTETINETYFQWFVHNKDCIPTTQGRCCQPRFVYLNTSEIKEIAGKYLPVFDCDFILSSELCSFFKFTENLKLNDYLTILKNIVDDTLLSDEEQKENKKRVGLIYQKLALMDLHSFDQETIRIWGSQNKLLSKDGKTFFYPKDLSIVTVEGFNAPNLAYIEEQSSEIIELLRLFGVTIIDTVTPLIPNSIKEMEDLKSKLIDISPLIAVISIEKSKKPKEWRTEHKRIYKKLTNVHFFKTTEIYLSYGNESDKQKRSSWVKENDFYYVGNWYSSRVLDGLVDPLVKFLGIRYAERLLLVLLLEKFTDGIEYLKEKGYDVNLIPEDCLNTKESEMNTSSLGRVYNLSDEELGRKGEEFVFDELKRIYSKKYTSSIEETNTGFKIGSFVEVIWRNINGNTNADHDFKIVEDEKELYMDSKATPYSKNNESKIPFYISKNEYTLMENAEKYLIARVYNVTTEPMVEFIKLELDNID
ncbi:hypothetical protein C7H19_11020 [Aphanothece hegewaldii CCALA 016]|uniref:Protein NO VEIN C-terminal domain-containing protein n=1 Tax=Aphanothece hegewaldii CCALA 016 TaxID=2107694 RepID=A0A2T1LXY0_9CHRO|nr:DUF3883 domain-containing protein [Aphanothece hegewaldii]PSF37245.1 hypothetical protein C7H19_11020 [Aphanothece hegewaldii CCALA 016]